MDKISQYFNEFGLNFDQLLITAGIILLGTLLLSAIGRFVFGKKSVLTCAVSSAIGILFVYALNIVLPSAGAEFGRFITPLPFISITGDTMTLFQFSGTDYTLICGELVSLILLAFLMNLIDQFIPKGKNVLTWAFFRVLTVVLAQGAHLLLHWILTAYLPEGILLYAPAIILGILLLMLATGALKLLVGLFLSTVNPVIGALYTFFFANVIGKQITKAVLTTGILAALVYGLEQLGITTICIATGALVAYLPLMVLLLILWYFVIKLF